MIAYAGAPPSASMVDVDSIENFQKRLNVNTVSAVVAADEAIKGFLKLEAEGKLGPEGATYLFTGNALNEKAASRLITLGLGKAATAHVIDSLAHNTSNNDKHFRSAYSSTKSTPDLGLCNDASSVVGWMLTVHSFYFVDERHEDGRPMVEGANGDAHAEEFLKLAQDPKQGPWQYTFTKGIGYKAFTPKDWTL